MAFTAFPDANVTTLVGLFEYGNTVTNNFFGIFILIAIYIIIMVSMMRKGEDIIKPAAASSFITFLISMLFRAAGLVKNEFVIFFLIMSVFFLFLFWKKEDE